MRRGKRQEARGNSKGIGGDSANLKNKRFKCVLAYQIRLRRKGGASGLRLGSWNMVFQKVIGNAFSHSLTVLPL
ncbi:hypothetical protein N44_01384 [Microcystis aeruginosa NIES-44]|uniref:Uncharacterized protein n=1 Tax=Microcystis aeruginosa NIES-44 TaxID=449439 RepID=A0A0A1VU70_MICAE|nr:hypothetical protein N44_01384 [Microcystis aeruginosa NIES-44]